jgi:hypothetical protein
MIAYSQKVGGILLQFSGENFVWEYVLDGSNHALG